MDFFEELHYIDLINLKDEFEIGDLPLEKTSVNADNQVYPKHPAYDPGYEEKGCNAKSPYYVDVPFNLGQDQIPESLFMKTLVKCGRLIESETYVQDEVHRLLAGRNIDWFAHLNEEGIVHLWKMSRFGFGFQEIKDMMYDPDFMVKHRWHSPC